MKLIKKLIIFVNICLEMGVAITHSGDMRICGYKYQTIIKHALSVANPTQPTNVFIDFCLVI